MNRTEPYKVVKRGNVFVWPASGSQTYRCRMECKDGQSALYSIVNDWTQSDLCGVTKQVFQLQKERNSLNREFEQSHLCEFIGWWWVVIWSWWWFQWNSLAVHSDFWPCLIKYANCQFRVFTSYHFGRTGSTLFMLPVPLNYSQSLYVLGIRGTEEEESDFGGL